MKIKVLYCMFVYLFKSIGTQTRERKGIVIGKSIPLSLGTKIVPSEESNREKEKQRKGERVKREKEIFQRRREKKKIQGESGKKRKRRGRRKREKE